MGQIRGQRAEAHDNNPVEVRRYQIAGGLSEALGRFPTSPIWFRSLSGRGYIHWQYFPNGIIISTPDTCACVIYGPIYHYWDQTGQFDGPLGAPSTDILRMPSPPVGPGSPPPPPGASYAVFQHGVLYLDPDINASVAELSPVAQSMVTSGTGIVPTGPGIAQAAAGTIQGVAANALATDQGLAENVEGISTRVTYHSTGPGGCAGGGFNATGRSLLRSHLLDVHFDFDLTGCGGTFGDAWADVRLEVRLFIHPPTVTARLVNFWIVGVGSPFGAGDRDIRDGLMRSLNGQFARDLLNRTIPAGITVLAGIVEPNGDVNLYIAPICSTAAVLSSSAASIDTAASKLRQLRDDHLLTKPKGLDFIEVTRVFGPALVAAIRQQRDGPALHEAVARLLTETFTEEADLYAISARLEEVNGELQALLLQPSLANERGWPERFVRMAISYIRGHVKDPVSFEEVLSHLRGVIREEIERCGKHGADDTSAG